MTLTLPLLAATLHSTTSTAQLLNFIGVKSGRPLVDDGKIKSSQSPKTESKVILNDPAINEAWGIKKSQAAKAWEVTQGSKEIVVAVIDTGIDIRHDDLKNNLWTNPGESGLDAKGRDKRTNGIDDDGDGFTDNVHGWNFVSNNHDLSDNHGHGSHIAGIIGAEAGNGKGIAGVAPKVSLMILKYYDPKVPKTDNLKNTIEAIKFATSKRVNIINYSGGGTDFSKEEFEAVKAAKEQGILFVAAAGNERSNSDEHKYYPADYGLENIISVTAIDPKTEVLASSNYGVQTVDLAAPGQNILSTLPNNAYGFMTGTSQATAFVSGAAVLIMAKRSSFDYQDVKKYILATGDQKQSLSNKTKTARYLNLFRAVTMLDTGVNVSGMTVANAVGINHFGSDPNVKTSPEREISNLGRAILQKVESRISQSEESK
jgi:thermitase